jgi:hypothetical protein
MLAKTLLLASALTLGLASAAAAQAVYSYETAPSWSVEVEPVYPGPILRGPDYGYEPGYVVIDPGYGVEPDYNTGFMPRDPMPDGYYRRNRLNTE